MKACLRIYGVLLGALFLLACHQSEIRDPSKTKTSTSPAAAPASGSLEPFTKEEAQASEPVMVGGAFLRANCGPYKDLGSQTLYACAIVHDAAKVSVASISKVSLESSNGILEPQLQKLGSTEAWHVSFALPQNLDRANVRRVMVSYEWKGENFQKASEAILSSSSPNVARTSPAADQASPITLDFPLATATRSWFTTFDEDPTAFDRNGDSLNDWNLTKGTDLKPSLSSGVLTIANSNVQLKSNPYWTNPQQISTSWAMADLTQNPAIDSVGAEFWVNVDYGVGLWGQVFCFLKKNGDGTQTAFFYTKTQTNPRLLIEDFPGLPGGMVRFGMLLDTVNRQVRIKIEGQEYGPFTYSTLNLPTDTGAVTLDGRGSMAAFSYVMTAIEDGGG